MQELHSVITVQFQKCAALKMCSALKVPWDETVLHALYNNAFHHGRLLLNCVLITRKILYLLFGLKGFRICKRISDLSSMENEFTMV